jgi:nucleoside-diphosphate-sugar epimerase
LTRILVTGAAGFLGRALTRRFAVEGGDWLRLDREIEDGPGRALRGDLADPDIVREAAAFAPDIVFHLASVPGTLAERDAALSRRVNLDASLNLFAALAASGRRPRIVYASSVAVYGEAAQGCVSRDTSAAPVTTYGAHKRMVEIALLDHARRGELSGLALRLPGVIARSEAAGFGSAFMSKLPRAVAAGRPYVCPVAPGAVAWWMSAACAAKNLMRAADMEATGVYQPPALRLSVGDVLEASLALHGESRRGLVTFEPDARIEAVFGRFGELDTGAERKLGFCDDGDAQALLRAALEPLEESP